MKKLRKTKFSVFSVGTVGIVALVVVIVATQIAIAAYNAPANNKTQANNKSTEAANADEAPVTDKASFTAEAKNTKTLKSAAPQSAQNQIDISGIKLGSDLETTIANADLDNKDKNIERMKELIAFLGIPDQYQDKINDYITNGYNIYDVFSIYEFLYQEYGNFDDMKKLLDMTKDGKTLSEAFKSFEDTHKEFVPTNFDSAYLEKLMFTDKMKTDDIMLADRLSQKGLGTFDSFIQSRIKGKAWKDLCLQYNILNTSNQLPHFSVDNEEVKGFMEKYKLSKDTVLSGCVIAYKFNLDKDSVLKDIKSGSTKSEIYAKAADLKYGIQ